jgi:hypothetical protein
MSSPRSLSKREVELSNTPVDAATLRDEVKKKYGT